MKGDPLPILGDLERNGDSVSAKVTSKVDLKEAKLNYAVASGAWQSREWKSIDAQIKDGVVLAKLPSNRPLVYYLQVVDQRNLNVSTTHAILEK
jgi:hypothetical protein